MRNVNNTNKKRSNTENLQIKNNILDNHQDNSINLFTLNKELKIEKVKKLTFLIDKNSDSDLPPIKPNPPNLISIEMRSELQNENNSIIEESKENEINDNIQPQENNSNNSPIQNEEQEKYLKIKIEKFIEKEKEREKKKKRRIKFNYCDFLKLIFCGKFIKNKNLKESQKVFDGLKDRINDNLDIVNYIKLFENFHKLKKLLLNPDQNFSFDYLSNRPIDDILKNNLEDNLRSSFKYFNERNNKNLLDSKDKELLNNFDNNFQEFLNQ